MKSPPKRLKQDILNQIAIDKKIQLSIIKPFKVTHWPFYAIVVFGLVSIAILSAKLKWGNMEETMIAVAMVFLLITSFGLMIWIKLLKMKQKM